MADESKCTMPISPIDPSCATNVSRSSVQPINLLPGKEASLHCVLLSSLNSATCVTHLNKQLSLHWVDENGDPVKDDSECHIKQQSECDVTLTVALRSPKSVTFRCKAVVKNKMWTSSEVKVRLSAPAGKGRGFAIDLDQPQSGAGDQRDQSNQDMVGTIAGVLGAVVLMAAAAVFVMKKRRTNTRLPSESHTLSGSCDLNSDNVIYADIILPAASDRVCVPQSDTTEYACVCYT